MIDETRQDSDFPRRAPPIVGRSAERVLLREQLESVMTNQGQLCILSGEAGIGKTTLVRELEATARLEGMHVLVGQCYDLMAAPPYGIWLDLASSYRPVGMGGIPLPKVLASGELHNITSQSEVFDQVRSFLADVSASQPTLVVLEDVHCLSSQAAAGLPCHDLPGR
jgi:ABC-type ATPase with predicted acetyltransferase domain